MPPHLALLNRRARPEGLTSTAVLGLAVSLLMPGAPSAAGPHARPPSGHRLLVISVDGLDWRYLQDADRLGLKIPHIRRLLAEGDVGDGVVGEDPTVTWPAHTTLITGAPPSRHGIPGNRRPDSDGGAYYWETALVRARLSLRFALGRPVSPSRPST